MTHHFVCWERIRKQEVKWTGMAQIWKEAFQAAGGAVYWRTHHVALVALAGFSSAFRWVLSFCICGVPPRGVWLGLCVSKNLNTVQCCQKWRQVLQLTLSHSHLAASQSAKCFFRSVSEWMHAGSGNTFRQGSWGHQNSAVLLKFCL